MTLLIIIAKAVGLILAAALLFLFIAETLNVSREGVLESSFAGHPIAGCFLTII